MAAFLRFSCTQLYGCVVPVLVVCFVVSGCGEREISERELPKGVDRIATMTEPGEAPHDHEEADEALPWVVPDGWRRVHEHAPMRLATFAIEHPGGEVKVLVSRFSGDVGGELANVNRWRRQVGLGPLDAGELDEVITRFGRAGYAGYRVRIGGEESILITAGVYEAERDQTWFVKAVVPSAELADRLEGEVVEFAQSIGAHEPGQLETQ